MKHYLLLILVAVFWSTCPELAFGSDRTINIKGKWGDNIIRTISPQAPEVSIDGNVLSVYCADALSDLTITVTDAEGNVIQKECVTISSGETVSFTLDETVGTYQVHLSHQYGYLLGDFVLY